LCLEKKARQTACASKQGHYGGISGPPAGESFESLLVISK
jgi:hypothetical protein